MKIISKNCNNDGIRIHYLDTMNAADPSLVPILICPGLSETAEEYEDLLEYLLPRRGIALSFRGRGQSDTPFSGYDLRDHITDIEAVVEATQLDLFHIFGNSRGVSYALGYAKEHPNKIAKIIVEDYPSEHKAMPVEWPDDYIDNYLVPYGRLSHIRPEAIRGIQAESTSERIEFQFPKPVLVMHGLMDESLISDKDLLHYKSQFPNLQIIEFENSGHNIRSTEKAKLFGSIQNFLNL